MRYFGDTMRNYGVRHLPDGVVELYRRRPVKYGNQASSYWMESDCGTYAKRVFPVRTVAGNPIEKEAIQK